METFYITGVGGLVGSYLSNYLVEQKYHSDSKVIGSFFNPTTDLSLINKDVILHEADVRDVESINTIIDKYRPNKIFHLAAQSLPSISWNRPNDTFNVNVNGTINLFESIKKTRSTFNEYNPTVIVACSSAQYGQSMVDNPTKSDESMDLLPLSPYGVSKVAQDLLAYQYFQSFNINTIRARIFNTTGPRKINDVLSDFTEKAVLIKLGKLNKFTVGNLETIRAITDVRDLVNALILLSERGQYGEAYNICGKNHYKISELITIIENIMDFKLNPVVDKLLLRPTDERIIFGDSSKLIAHTNWTQLVPINKTIKDMLDYWLSIHS